MRVTRSLFISALVLCATASPCLATADGARRETTLEAARALANEGQEAYETGRFAEAAEAAREAQKLVSAPTLALLEARSLKQLDLFLAARARYRIAAAPLPSDASLAFHLARQAALAELLTLEDEVPHLVIELRSARGSEVPRVSVDGKLWPTTSLGVWVAQDPGEHVVEAVFGARIERHLVRLGPRDHRRLFLGAPMDQGSGSKLRAPLAITSFGLSALGIGAGIGFAVQAANLREDLDAACPEAICPQARADTLRNYRTARDVSTVGYVVGVGGAAMGVVVLSLPASQRKEKGTPSLTLSAGQLRFRGRF